MYSANPSVLRRKAAHVDSLATGRAASDGHKIALQACTCGPNLATTVPRQTSQLRCGAVSVIVVKNRFSIGALPDDVLACSRVMFCRRSDYAASGGGAVWPSLPRVDNVRREPAKPLPEMQSFVSFPYVKW